MVPELSTIAKLREDYTACFGCGLENSSGLQLDGFTVSGDTVTTVFDPPGRFQGFDGVLHGGVVATALDEISAWTAMLTNGVFVFTAKLDIAYRKQAPLGVPLTLTGHVSERRGRRLRIDAVMAHGDPTIAESHGLFVVAGEIDKT